MRTYPTDSPEAAARIVALTLVSDGHVSKQEMDVLDRVGTYEALGIDRAGMLTVLQDFCEELLQAQHAQWSDACQIDPRTLNLLMAEVADPLLRMAVLRLCIAIAEADGHIADGESIVLVNAVEHWGLHFQMLKPSASHTAG